jgi:hypothetical protein
MELKDLKSAWATYSSQEVDKHRLGKENIHELLKNQTITLVDRIDRNIRVGMIVILVFIVYVIIDDLYLSKIILSESMHYPAWMVPMDVFSNVIIVTTYLFFVLRYWRIKRSFSPDTQLNDFLKGILDTLTIYRRLFYLAVVILLINMVVSFAAGLYQGVKINTGALNGGIESLAISKVFIIILIGLAFLIPLILGTFFILRWGFNKLYGRYLIKLNETLLELDESGNADL